MRCISESLIIIDKGWVVMINVITTVDSRETLERIGRLLLEKRLVACLQILGPVRSIYRWKGQIEEAEEWIGIMKTRRELYGDVEAEIKALHPYEVPQIEAIEAVSVLPAGLTSDWPVD